MQQRKPVTAALAALILISFTLPATAQAARDTHQSAVRDTHFSQNTDQKEHDKYETSGVLGGMALGALAGGPVGAIASAAFGGWLGNKLHAAKISDERLTELELNQEQLLSLQEKNRLLEQYLLALNQQLDQRNLLASTNYTATATQDCCKDSELTLHFRTNSAKIESHYLAALKEFAKLAESASGAAVEISGYTDRRGENANNLALSQQRVQQVESTLRELGLRKAKYLTAALGEKQPLSPEDSFESNFYDRRVQLRLVNQNAELLTHTQP